MSLFFIMKILLLLLLECFYFTDTYAVSAFPYPIKILIDGKYLMLTLHGDENCKYALTDDGYTVLQNSDGWFYAKEDENGEVIMSNYRLLHHSDMSDEQKSFLTTLKKNLIPKREQKLNISKRANQYGEEKDIQNVSGNRRVLVVLVEFSDLRFRKTKEDFVDLFNKTNYNDDGAVGSVKDYYLWASHEQLNLQSDIIGPYTLSHNMAYYGGNNIKGNDKNTYGMFTEAIEFAADEVNLQDYDSNGDGYIDNVHIIFAGYGEEAGATSDAIWSHRASFPTITVDDVKIDGYSCAAELRGNSEEGISRIGVHCHEIGHALGANDYYDVNYSEGGQFEGTGKWDIMASGSWNNGGISPAGFNPYVRVYDFGWENVDTLEESGLVQLTPTSEKGGVIRLNTIKDGDFFLLENRIADSFDTYIPGSGMLVYHISPGIDTAKMTNEINATYPQLCYIVCASSGNKTPSYTASSYGEINSPGCPYPGDTNNTGFSASSVPAAKTFDDKDTGFSIQDIKYEDGIITFYYNKEESPIESEDIYTELVWNDSFERQNITDKWTITSIMGMSRCDIERSLLGIDTNESPIAKDGTYYLKITSKDKTLQGDKRTTLQLNCYGISLDQNKSYILTIDARRYCPKDGTCDYVNFYDNGSCIKSATIENNNAWQTLYQPIKEGVNTYTIDLGIDLVEGSTLFLDNVCIYEREVSRINTLKAPLGHKKIFNLQGQHLSKAHSGLYIIDGKKLIIK